MSEKRGRVLLAYSGGLGEYCHITRFMRVACGSRQRVLNRT